VRSACQPSRRYHPDVALAVLGQRDDDVVGKSIGGREGPETSVLQKREASSVGANPQTAFVVFLKRPDLVVMQSARLDVEGGEALAVEPDQPAVGSEPHVPVPALHDGPDAGLSEPFGFPPVVDAITGVLLVQAGLQWGPHRR